MQPNMYGQPTGPGVTELGDENNGQAVTTIRFLDQSVLRVHWDGHHQVAGMTDGRGPVTVYLPSKSAMRRAGRRLYIPWHRIDLIDHQEREEETA